MSHGRKRLILFMRFPMAGRVKTRLIPALGAEGAAALHRRLVLRTLRTALKCCAEIDAELEIRFDAGSEGVMRHWLGDCCLYREQGVGDLGQRMARAFERCFEDACAACVIIGSDCPGLTPEILTTAFGLLKGNSVIIGPATDGGYYLLGVTHQMPELFRGIDWGTDVVLRQ